MMNIFIAILKIVIFLYLFGIFIYNGRYYRASRFDRPLILNSQFIQAIFTIFGLITIAYIGYLIFSDWKVLVIGLVIYIIFRNKIEEIALYPFCWLDKKAEEKLSNKSRDM